MFLSNQKIESIVISAKIKRRNGDVEDLGTIVEYRKTHSIKDQIINFIKGAINGIFK